MATILFAQGINSWNHQQ